MGDTRAGYATRKCGDATAFLHARAVAGAAFALTILVLAGCGGSSTPASLKTPSSKVTAAAGLLGSARSAGQAQTYVPTGKIIADSGFRPQVDGFDFENYGNDAEPVNMTAANVYDMFGAQVCSSGRSTRLRIHCPSR